MKFEFEKRIEYIFDGRKVILEKKYATEGSPATTASAGGVGGLLATIATKSNPATVGTEIHYFHYDANGNVTETIDSNGDLTESYEYGPFGELVSETGSYSAAEGSPDDCGKNTYKFSTKPQDVETGYYYYGYRHYDPSMGRWLNRDPLGEFDMSKSELDSFIRYLKSLNGFTQSNIYAFIQNEALNNFDILGEKKWKQYIRVVCYASAEKNCTQTDPDCPCTAGSQGDGAAIADSIAGAQSKARARAKSRAGACGKGCTDTGNYFVSDEGCDIIDRVTIIYD